MPTKQISPQGLDKVGHKLPDFEERYRQFRKNVFGIEVVNIATHPNSVVCPSPAPHQCSIFLKVGRRPSFHQYHRVGNELVSYDDMTGFMNSYTHSPGTTEGFGGREITLPVAGGGRVFSTLGRTPTTFRGSLWSTAAAKRAAGQFFGMVPVSVAYRERSDGCPIGCEVDEALLHRLLKDAGLRFLSKEEVTRLPDLETSGGKTREVGNG